MKKIIFIFSILLINLTTLANNNDILMPSVFTTDLNGDSLDDFAMLIPMAKGSDYYVNLVVNISNDKSYTLENIMNYNVDDFDKPSQLLISLSKNKLGSLQVTYNHDLGRNRWQEVLTFAFRKQSLVLAGYAYDSWDAVLGENSEYNYGCDINLLNAGKGTFYATGVKGNKVTGTMQLNDTDRALYNNITKINQDSLVKLNNEYCQFGETDTGE